MLTPGQLKLITIGLALIIGALLFRNWLNERDKNQSNAATADQAVRTGQAVVDIGGKLGEASTDVAAKENTVRTERIYIQAANEKVRNENASVMDWSNGVIPVELRDADRAARIAAKRTSDLQSGAKTDSSETRN